MAEPKSFTAKSSGIARALVTPARVCAAFDPRKTDPNQMRTVEFKAIWDTGATNTVITQNVVNACGLKPFSMTHVQTANGTTNAELYLVNIVVPNGMAFAQIRVSKGTITQGIDVLIGMDIITTGDFSISNKDGKTCFSFRRPSMETIDFNTTHAVKSASKAPEASSGTV